MERLDGEGLTKACTGARADHFLQITSVTTIVPERARGERYTMFTTEIITA